jgi:U3 small nucleolar RNA-associated protein 15
VPPAVTFSLIQELVHRDGMRIALAGRDDVLLEPVLNLLIKHLSDPRFGEMVCDVASIVIGKSPFGTPRPLLTIDPRHVFIRSGAVAYYRRAFYATPEKARG